ncbi:arylesterase [Acidovorax sp. GBBC 3334]|uniref:arylesterase n=1 Tax=Acidovorax sp. GBBC 3334 TaxID=2940496 RepID=UPI0023028143|nr:arylesterase [Acidovorax sp. GBBC 3334]MDA8453418.1 arylesterase [Acidovorax sp. GBBC 3334]
MRMDGFRRDFIVATASAAVLGLYAPIAAAQPAAAAGGKPVILVVGDSLSAEYGLARGTGWVALLEKKLAQEKIAATVVNASVSGDTTAGGRSRLPGLLAQHRPTHVILELGGNDALRGLPLQGTEANLQAMAEASRKAGAQVLIVGMQVPPNYGSDYTRRFEGVFASVARSTQSALVPFLLKGVADGPNPTAMFQADRIHPRAEAHPLMLANVWPELRRLLR